MSDDVISKAIESFSETIEEKMVLMSWLEGMEENAPQFYGADASVSIADLRSELETFCNAVGLPYLYAVVRVREFNTVTLIVRLPQGWNVSAFERMFDRTKAPEAKTERVQANDGDYERGQKLIELIDEWIADPEKMKPYSGGVDLTDDRLIRKQAIVLRLNKLALFKNDPGSLDRVIQLAVSFGYIEKLNDIETSEKYNTKSEIYRRLEKSL